MAQRLPNLERLRRRLGDADNALLTASNVLRREARALIQEGFETRTDPIGRPWKPRKSAYAHPILEKTGALRKGWFVRKRGDDTVFGNDVPYAKFHQDGTRKMVARKMVPDRSLSPKWRARIDGALSAALADFWRNGRVTRGE